MDIDIRRIAAAAVEAAFAGENDLGNGRDETHHGDTRNHGRLGTAGAVAAGVVIATVARAAYTRARNLDLEQIAEAVEERLAR
jgi:hypothetical protein